VLGTSFTIADVLRVDLVKDYNAKLLGTEKVQGRPAYKLELTAKDETVPFARILYWADAENFLPLQSEFYTETGKLLRRALYEERKQLAGALRPSKSPHRDAFSSKGRTSRSFRPRSWRGCGGDAWDLSSRRSISCRCSRRMRILSCRCFYWA
jgi:hypothetical protein